MKAEIFFTQDDLVHRWHISPATLERWRGQKSGPPFVKVGSRVLYRISDIEAYEDAATYQKMVKTSK